MARHGFDRPVDYRRLHWSRWFRCESPHSLLVVPSKPGVFAVAEEIMDFGSSVEERRFSAASGGQNSPALAAVGISPDAGGQKPEAAAPRRMLAVTQFFEDDDMAYVLDRMLSRENPLRARLASGRYFVRFVVIEELAQRRSIANALNQWIATSTEKATGIGAHFATSLELTPATEYVPQAHPDQANLFENNACIGRAVPAETTIAHVGTAASAVQRSEPSGLGTKLGLSPSTSIQTSPHLDSGAASNIHCPSPFPSGF